jgi:hypothetical protein
LFLDPKVVLIDLHAEGQPCWCLSQTGLPIDSKIEARAGRTTMSSDPTVLILLYFILPIWLIAGFADWLCHRRAHIESTADPKESLIHLLMFAEMGVPLLLALFLEINSLIIAVMIAAFLIHEVTALWDVTYATAVRSVTPRWS